MIVKDDASSTLNELKQIVQRFCEERDWDKYHDAKDLAIGIVTEGSELLQQFRFKSEDDVGAIFESQEGRKMVGEEMADTLYFVLRLTQRYDIDLTTEFLKKMKKNEIRYPVWRSKGSNKKYSELRS